MKRIKVHTCWMWWTVLAVSIGVGLTGPTLVEATNFTFTKIADTSTIIPNDVGIFTSFYDFDDPLFADGQVAFQGFDSAGNTGIYADLSGTLERVIDLSVPLESGKTLVNLRFGLQDLSGNALAFYAAFDDGSVGIYRADEAIASSEPSTFLLLATGLTSLLGYGWWRRQRAA